MFAIVITLLVIELGPPELDEGASLAHALWEQWPSYAAYLVSFAVIGVMWLNHHRIFDQVIAVDGPLLLLNLLLLLWTAVIPFPTSLVAEFLREGGEQASTALAVYSGVVLGAAISYTALYAWITHDERLIGELPPPSVVRVARIRFGVGLVAYSLALVCSWISAPLTLAIHGVMAMYYAFDQASVMTLNGAPQE